jgi:cyclophilin family peptidyl-prolyl cis-trans isomerase
MQNILSLFFGVLLLTAMTSCHSYDIPSADVVNTLQTYHQTHAQLPLLRIHTDQGDMVARLYNETPLHRANFARLIDKGYYNKGNFYRLVPNFVIQGGNTSAAKLQYTIPAEFNPQIIHKRGSLAMARYDQNNPKKQSSPTEFYIVQGRQLDVPTMLTSGTHLTETQQKICAQTPCAYELDNQYTVFGEITEGFEVLEKLTNNKVFDDEKPLHKINFSIDWVK